MDPPSGLPWPMHHPRKMARQNNIHHNKTRKINQQSITSYTNLILTIKIITIIDQGFVDRENELELSPTPNNTRKTILNTTLWT